MFVERKVRHSALLTNLVRWHAGAVSFPLSGIILYQLACTLCDVMFCLHSGIANISLFSQAKFNSRLLEVVKFYLGMPANDFSSVSFP
jgi:hypothetical protein